MNIQRISFTKYHLLICFIFLSLSLSAQDWRLEAGDEWFNEHRDGLKVGDQMPDIPLGNVVNNKTGKTKFSDFKGKLVILDFWGTTCGSCLAAMPRMERLQREFGDKIQIFIVNVSETQKQIEERLKDKTISGAGYTHKKVKLPDLPSIVDAKELYKLFPLRAVPYHVWIDGTGTVRIMGPHCNTYAQKIRDLLAGKAIDYIPGVSTTPQFNKEMPYYKVIGKQINPLQNNYFLTGFNTEYATYGGLAIAEDLVNNTARTIRSTYVNVDIVELYKSVFKETLKKEMDKTLASSSEMSYRWNPYVLLFVKDTLSYTNYFIPDSALTDKIFARSKFCYEQITPQTIEPRERRQYMLKNINQYFGDLYGVEGKLEKHKTTCYLLIRTSKTNKLSSKVKNADNGSTKEQFIENGKKMIKYKNLSLTSILQNTDVLFGPFSKSFTHKTNGLPEFILDETGITGNVDMVLPSAESILNMEDLRKALRPYDLDIIKKEQEMEFVVLREKGYKK